MSVLVNRVPPSGRMPRSLTWATLAICAAPFLLNVVGVDFGSSRPGFPWADMPTMDPDERIDAMFHALSGSFTHTLLEWTAFLTAIFTLLLAFMHFKISRDVTTPVIGVALFCAGVMDAFHTLAADRLIESVADNSNLIPFTWAISRIFNALILIVGVGIFMHQGIRTLKGDLRFVVGISAGFLILAYSIITYCANSAQLPQTMYPDSLISRPFDVAPLVLFVLAGLTLFRWFYQQQPGIFTHALLLSMVPEVVVELHMAFGSTELFDNHFNIAHFIKIFAYFVPFLGLALDYLWTYQKLEQEMANREKAEEERARMNKELIDTSRRVGMADVATGVLHNVGNVLNSVNVASGIVGDIVRRSSMDKVSRTAALIQDHLGDVGNYLTQDPKGQQIPEYLNKLGHQLTQEQEAVLRELKGMTENIEHIKEIITVQQTVTKSSSMEEPVFLAELMQQALNVSQPAFEKYQVEVTKDYASVSEIVVDKHQVLQVLVNLISNAMHAMQKVLDRPRLLTVRIVQIEEQGREWIKLEVSDTGVGISPENMKRMFTQGFTTKRDGHGFGLHSGSLSAKLMGGCLTVQSEGIDQGATFTLMIPAKRREVGVV